MERMKKTGWVKISPSLWRGLCLLFLCVFFLFTFRSLSPGAEKGESGDGTVTIWQASDLHYLSPSLTDHGALFERLIQNADGKVMNYCVEVLDSLLEAAVREKPDVLILSGDLTFNGERKSHEELSGKLLPVLEAGVQVLVLPGNHDIASRSAASFSGDSWESAENVSGEVFYELYRPFGFEEALSRDRNSLSYVAEVTEDLRILMLDVNTEGHTGFLQEETYFWAEEELRKAREAGCRILTVSHQNVLAHNSVFFDGFMIGNGSALPGLYQKYGVLLNLSGHMHVQHIQQGENGLCEIAVSSLMVYPNQFNVLKVGEHSLKSYTRPCRVSLSAEDPAIETYGSFENYSHAFFWGIAYRSALEETDSGEEDLGRFFADVNTGYFAGRLDQAGWDDGLYDRWRKKASLISIYLMSIEKERDSNQTRLELSF